MIYITFFIVILISKRGVREAERGGKRERTVRTHNDIHNDTKNDIHNDTKNDTKNDTQRHRERYKRASKQKKGKRAHPTQQHQHTTAPMV